MSKQTKHSAMASRFKKQYAIARITAQPFFMTRAESRVAAKRAIVDRAVLVCLNHGKRST